MNERMLDTSEALRQQRNCLEIMTRYSQKPWTAESASALHFDLAAATGASVSISLIEGGVQAEVGDLTYSFRYVAQSPKTE